MPYPQIAPFLLEPCQAEESREIGYRGSFRDGNPSSPTYGLSCMVCIIAPHDRTKSFRTPWENHPDPTSKYFYWVSFD